MLKGCYASILFFLSLTVVAQESEIPIIKAEVSESQIMFKKVIWRRMDLNEKQNRPFNSKNSELSRLLIMAVEEGLLKPYESDSCITLMADTTFQSRTRVERQGGGMSGGFGGGGFGGGFGTSAPAASSGPEYDPIPRELFSVVYLREDLIFDRNRSRMYWYIRTISLALPGSAGATWNPAGFEKTVAHFKYEDVVNLFRGPYAKKAIWYNSQNLAAHRNYGDAFELRLFKAPITKVSNADDLDVSQQESDPYKAILLRQKLEYDLMEFESELWEY